MDRMEVRERLRSFGKLLRIPELNIDNITIEDLNLINLTISSIINDYQNQPAISFGFLDSIMRDLKLAIDRSGITLDPNQIDQSGVIQYLQSTINYLIDYKTNNPAP